MLPENKKALKSVAQGFQDFDRGLSRQNVEPTEADFQEYLPAQSQYGQCFDGNEYDLIA